MLKLILFLISLAPISALACQSPPIRTDLDVAMWESMVMDGSKIIRGSIITDIVFPQEFKGYQLSGIKLFSGDGTGTNEFAVPIEMQNGSMVKAMIGSEIVKGLVFSVSYSNCGYIFEYKIGELRDDGL